MLQIPVNVFIYNFRKPMIYDQLHTANVESTRCHIGRYQGAHIIRFEFIQGGHSFTLPHEAMQAHILNAYRVECHRQ